MYANWGHSSPPARRRALPAPTMVTPKFSGAATRASRTASRSYNCLEGSGPDVHPHRQQRSLYGVNVSRRQRRRSLSSSAASWTTSSARSRCRRSRSAFSMPRTCTVTDRVVPPARPHRLNFAGEPQRALSPKFDLTVSAGIRASRGNRLPASDARSSGCCTTSACRIRLQGCPGRRQGLRIRHQREARYDPTDSAQRLSSSARPATSCSVNRTNDVQRMTGSFNGELASAAPGWPTRRPSASTSRDRRQLSICAASNECPRRAARRASGNVSDSEEQRAQLSPRRSSAPGAGTRAVGQPQDDGRRRLRRTSKATSPTAAGQALPRVARPSARGGLDVVRWRTRPAGRTEDAWMLRARAGRVPRSSVPHRGVRTDQNSAFGTNFQSVHLPEGERVVADLGRVVLPAVRLARTRSACARRTAPAACSLAARTGLRDVHAGHQNLHDRRTQLDDRHRHARAPAQPIRATPNLKPERSHEIETGFETQLLNNRVHIDYTYYRQDARTTR